MASDLATAKEDRARKIKEKLEANKKADDTFLAKLAEYRSYLDTLETQYREKAAANAAEWAAHNKEVDARQEAIRQDVANRLVAVNKILGPWRIRS